MKIEGVVTAMISEYPFKPILSLIAWATMRVLCLTVWHSIIWTCEKKNDVKYPTAGKFKNLITRAHICIDTVYAIRNGCFKMLIALIQHDWPSFLCWSDPVLPISISKTDVSGCYFGVSVLYTSSEADAMYMYRVHQKIMF